MEALEVYRQDYEARMLEALGSNYEATWLLLGDEGFFSLGKKYIFSHPSSFRSLIDYGHSFPEFLLSENAGGAVVAMAEFERAFWKLFHDEQNSSITLTQEDVLSTHFGLRKISLIQAPFKINEVWNHRQDAAEVLEDVDLEVETFLALFKADEKVLFLVLSEKGFRFLEELKQKEIISECQMVPEQDDWADIFSILKWSKRLSWA
nr:DNA-binding domain-containing protein [Bacteriovorax sp. HI3]